MWSHTHYGVGIFQQAFSLVFSRVNGKYGSTRRLVSQMSVAPSSVLHCKTLHVSPRHIWPDAAVASVPPWAAYFVTAPRMRHREGFCSASSVELLRLEGIVTSLNERGYANATRARLRTQRYAPAQASL